MKKNYQFPQMTVVKMQTQQMLAGSLTERITGVNEVTEGEAGARSFSGWDGDY